MNEQESSHAPKTCAMKATAAARSRHQGDWQWGTELSKHSMLFVAASVSRNKSLQAQNSDFETSCVNHSYNDLRFYSTNLKGGFCAYRLFVICQILQYNCIFCSKLFNKRLASLLAQFVHRKQEPTIVCALALKEGSDHRDVHWFYCLLATTSPDKPGKQEC